jgi:hypothetical protein
VSLRFREINELPEKNWKFSAANVRVGRLPESILGNAVRHQHAMGTLVRHTGGPQMVVMFALGRSRGRAWDALFVSAISLAIAAIPEALPTVRRSTS